MLPKMVWLVNVVRLTIVPVFLGALVLLAEPQRSISDLAAAACLMLLGTVHVLYWWQPWPGRVQRSVAAAAAMVVMNVALLHLLGLNQPLLWLYPALIVGAGLRPPASAVGVGLMALAAGAPLELDGSHMVDAFGPNHAILLSIVLAGSGMAAVRQLIALNADLHATRSELAEFAVANERDRLARQLHDLLGRTLSLIAVKAELAGRLSAAGDPSASVEMRDVQQLARHAVREVREAVAGDLEPNVAAELAAARSALQTAGIGVTVTHLAVDIDPAHEPAVAWALREAVTNVVRHSTARTCRIAIEVSDGTTALEVADDGRGPVGGDAGTGLAGLADRIQTLGGAFEAGPGETGGFRLRVRLGDATSPLRNAEAAR